jgi:hypothetical protein
MNILNKRIRVLFTVICLLFFFIACNKKVETGNNALVFDTIQVNKVHYWGGDTSKLSCKLQISFVYPTSGIEPDQLEHLQSLFTENVLSETLGSLSPQKAIDQYLQQYVTNFDRLNTEDFSTEDYSLEDESDFSYYLYIENVIVYSGKQFLSFIVKNDNYEGGAHGSHNVFGYVINLNTGELLNEEAFSGNNYKKNLSAMMIQKIAKANGVENAEQLENIGYINIEELAPNGNFTLDDKGITYYFNEYEIAAYFIGVTEVFIPYEELNIYTTKESPIASLAGL